MQRTRSRDAFHALLDRRSERSACMAEVEEASKTKMLTLQAMCRTVNFKVVAFQARMKCVE